MRSYTKKALLPGHKYDPYFPKSLGVDTVVQPEGKAKLHHTINLIKEMVTTTLEDTEKIAPLLKGATLRKTCENIWNFVYHHIRFKPDKKGTEQVRRPSRVWDDRATGCDCDCMTTMICSILTNLGIQHKIRITKYPSKNNPWLIPRYQHIYPIVPISKNGYITIDCVTDWFDYEVPYLEKKDFIMNDGVVVGTIEGLGGFSGVDTLALHEVISLPKSSGVRPRKEQFTCHHTTIAFMPKAYPQAEALPNKVQPSIQAKPQMQSRAAMLPATALRQDEQEADPSPPVMTNARRGLGKKLLIAGFVGIGTFQLVKLLTQ